MADKQDLILKLKEFMENEARSGSMDLTLSKSLTLGKAQVRDMESVEISGVL